MHMNETEIAVWLTEHTKENPLCNPKIYYQLGDWNVSGHIGIDKWGILEIDFQLDSCHGFLGFERLHDVEIGFNSHTNHSIRAVEAFLNITVPKYLDKFEEFLKSIPVKN